MFESNPFHFFHPLTWMEFLSMCSSVGPSGVAAVVTWLLQSIFPTKEGKRVVVFESYHMHFGRDSSLGEHFCKAGFRFGGVEEGWACSIPPSAFAKLDPPVKLRFLEKPHGESLWLFLCPKICPSSSIGV